MVESLEYKVIKGSLGAVRQLEEQGYRLQTSLELQNDRCQDGQEALQNRGFYVANSNVFYLGSDNQRPHWDFTDGEHNQRPHWGFTDGKHNLIIQSKYLDRALAELPRTNIFRPAAQESLAAIQHRSTKRFALDDLGLVKENNEWSFMPIKTDRYNALTVEQKKAAQTVGLTEANVAYLGGKKIRETKIWLPNPEWLAEVFADNKDPTWRASRLSYFFNFSFFFAESYYVIYHGSLRGVRRVVAAGDAPKNDKCLSVPQERQTEYELAYEIVLAHPEELTPNQIAGLAQLVANFRKQ